MLLAALLLIWPLTETHTAPESSCLMVRQGERVYLAMTVEVSRFSGAATVTLPGPDVTIGTTPPATPAQQAKFDACMAESAAKVAASAAEYDAKAAALRAWRDCRNRPVNCPFGSSMDTFMACINAGPQCGPEPMLERVSLYSGRYDDIACQATASIPQPRTKRSPGRVIELARYDSISNDVACVCKWDHCVVR